MKKISLLLAASWLLISGSALALSTDREQPIYIEADAADIDQLNNVVVYTGNVKISQGSLRIWGHVVTLYTDQNNKLIKAFADAKKGGLARFKQTPDDNPEDQWGEGERLEYWAQENLVKIFRKGRLWQGKDVFTSERILYDTEKEVMVGGSTKTNKKRVHMTLQPKN